MTSDAPAYITVTPVAALLVAWAVLFVALHFRNRARELRHKERMTALEKGIDLSLDAGPGPTAHLLRGLIWLFVGVGISIFFLALWMAEHDRDEAAMATLGLIPIGVGIAYVIVYRVAGKERPPSSLIHGE